jgi:hypothetical protein
MPFIEVRGPKSMFVNVSAIIRVEARPDQEPGALLVLSDATSYAVAEVESVVLQRIDLAGQQAGEAVLTLIDEAATSG